MNILYIANSRIPTEKAHGIQIMKTCEAFSNLGHAVTLVTPRRFNHITNDPFEYYKVSRIFKIVKLPVIDLVEFGRLGFVIELFSFSISALFYVLSKSKNSIVYSRDELPIFLINFSRKNIFWETHSGRWHTVAKLVARKCKGIISISQGLKDFYTENDIPANKIIVAHDGVSLEDFDIAIDKKTSREKLGLPQDKNIIMYTGHLYDWKGVQVLADAARLLSDKELVVFVGGTERDIRNFQNKNGASKNIFILGKKPHSDVPLYLKAADVLVLPNSGKNEISAKYTSPIKLFEYMASGTPIVASRTPSLQEVLNEKNALFTEPDDSSSFAQSIKRVLSDENLSAAVAQKALEDVRRYTWDKRAELIISSIENVNPSR